MCRSSLFWIILVLFCPADYLDDVKEYITLTQELKTLTDDLNTERSEKDDSEKLVRSMKTAVSIAYTKQVEAQLNKKHSAEAQYSIITSSYQNRLHGSYKNAISELEKKTKQVEKTHQEISNLNRKKVVLEDKITKSQHDLVSKYAEIKGSIIRLVKRSKNLDTLMREIDTEISVGDLTGIEQMPPCDIREFIKPTSGNIKTHDNCYIISGIPSEPIFAINSGIIIFAGKHKKYGIMIIIVHSMDYKSVIYGDISPSRVQGKFVKSGAVIGKVIVNTEPHLYIRTYYLNEPFLSTEIVDNFVDNATS